jgi:hypothetical protein
MVIARRWAAAAAVVSSLVAAGCASTGAGAPERLAGRPDLNGVWQANGTAHWNLEAHSAEYVPALASLGAHGGIPAGQSYVVGGRIPYLPDALAQRDENKAGWPASDPATACYLPGVPRANYMPYPFQIVQGEGDILFAYAFAKSNRIVHMLEEQAAPVDAWMGVSNGRWEGDTLVVEVIASDGRTWFDSAGNHHTSQMVVTERFTLVDENQIRYEATIEDPATFSEPWTIQVPIHRRTEENVELLDYNCIPIAEEFLYGHLEAEPEE